MKIYSVKETFLSVQGEGAQTGQVCVFVRFAGCNLWNGRDADRAISPCKFCDTDFIGTDGLGGGRFDSPVALAQHALDFWPQSKTDVRPWVIFTGGEPFLQLDDAVMAAFKAKGFQICVETNGSLVAPNGIDWLCVSPKGNTKLAQISGDELKLVYPQADNHPDDFVDLDFKRFSLQPLDTNFTKSDDDSPTIEGDKTSMQLAFEYCTAHPKWRLSVQTHKWLGVR